MERLYRRWEEPKSLFGDLAVIGFVIVQSLDGVFTTVAGHGGVSFIASSGDVSGDVPGLQSVAMAMGMPAARKAATGGLLVSRRK